MKYNELCQWLKKQGCEIERNGKRHDIWVNQATGGRIAMPRHGTQEVPKGLLKKIEKELLNK